MVHPLIGIHAALGELGAMAFLWVFVELLNPTEARIRRAKKVAFAGTVFLVLSWMSGGYYYVAYYGSLVKPLIKESVQPWAHQVIMEVKEHIFLFLPFLAAFVSSVLAEYKDKLEKYAKTRRMTMWVSVIIVAVSLMIAALGYVVSTAARAALEVKAG